MNVAKVPKGSKFYQVEISHRGKINLSSNDAEAGQPPPPRPATPLRRHRPHRAGSSRDHPGRWDGTRPGREAKTAALPDFTGMGLQAAQDRAQAAGFHLLHSHDALGRSRSQIDDRNRKVCSQAPAAGTALNGQPVTLGVVKFGEACP
ncbi:PASTA domain-containing protein [Kitasatospora sp. NRRL B-11411]|uniref:PASTA domain-containing protein n=1 Tax=Kitasatospora sp. NRRL B-11411 TaxID=1463822 RepID=UPI0012FF0932|nr:PASTA domain-containing protein [Kitasatospora sp. NRRL B-11411]